ncbi:MAG: riboflavin biosynthesis protein RibF [Bacteroidetes bacterium GWA2_30_7]|nr:MAG: riboflavin biosynthesis protein RibF [Bacteroidetes bacterium GWA2_30_7]
MKVWTNLKDFKAKNSVITIGTFDGVHLGHIEVIKTLLNKTAEFNGESVVFTFWPHPKLILPSNDSYKLLLLNNLEEKIELLSKTGIEHLIIYPFSVEFSNLSSCEFIEQILVKQVGIKALIVGYDHHFGHNREGNFDSLKECSTKCNFKVEQLSEYRIETDKISSSAIRNFIINGQVAKANKLLGYNYMVSGKVVDGKKQGKKLGFPTANIEINDNYKILPETGIFAVKVKYNSDYFNGMLSIGTNPTLSKENTKKTIEVNIFDFYKDIYQEKLTIEFIEKMRDEVRFDNIQLLIEQLKLDKVNALNILL